MSVIEPHYADRLQCQTVRVELNEQIARDTYRLRFYCPTMASACAPGQFLMVRLAGCDDPLIGRPFAMFDTVVGPTGSPESLEFVYLVGGKLTRRLCQHSPGQELEVWGPLGNGFPLVDVEHLILVAGGIGHTPFLAVAQEFLVQRTYGPRRVVASPDGRSVTLCYGARNRDYLAGVEQFRSAGLEVRLSTDDGSLGQIGRAHV